MLVLDSDFSTGVKLLETRKMNDEAAVNSIGKKKRRKGTRKNQRKKKKIAVLKRASNGSQAKFPRHNVEKALRIPRAIIDQNAGKECSDKDTAKYVGVGFNGPYRVEISSALKYGFLERPRAGIVSVTERARQAIRPQKNGDEIDAMRAAVLAAPDISAVYSHYRGENLPDGMFFQNALADKFGIPADKVSEFTEIFLTSLQSAKLLEKSGDKYRVLDVTAGIEQDMSLPNSLKKVSQGVKISSGDSCFVMMPFAAPIGHYYQHIYEPAIVKAGLRPIRADTDIFGTGKIMDQIWSGINDAKVLLAELTRRNPNVFYELGLAHALKKPVVLVSSNEDDVPFDLQHIRVIYYDVTDPFWGQKLMEKVAENVLSAIKNPEEAIFQRALQRE